MLYWLPHHVHLCLYDGGAVWLNARADQYIGQDRAELRGFNALVAGWPADEHDNEASTEEAANVAEQLAAAGLLTRERTGHSAAPLSVQLAHVPFDTEGATAIPIHEHTLAFSRFLKSRITTHYALRGRSFEYALERLRERKAGLRDEWIPADVGRARSLLALFNDWQLFIFSTKDRCLAHALWLGEFLALHRLGFQFIIGINKHSLAYHCWIQVGDWILTGDEPMKLRAYLPIVEL